MESHQAVHPGDAVVRQGFAIKIVERAERRRFEYPLQGHETISRFLEKVTRKRARGVFRCTHSIQVGWRLIFGNLDNLKTKANAGVWRETVRCVAVPAKHCIRLATRERAP
jgi:hypothetical protein